MKKNLRSPLVNFYETDRSDVKSYFTKQKGTTITANNNKSSTTSGKAAVFSSFLLLEDGFYLLQEDGLHLSL